MNAYKQIVKQVIDYIEDNLAHDIDMEQIAECIGYSRFHLNRIFTAETGCTIYKYLQARRLTVAAQALVDTDRPIAQIAYHSRRFPWLLSRSTYTRPRPIGRWAFSCQSRTGSRCSCAPGLPAANTASISEESRRPRHEHHPLCC